MCNHRKNTPIVAHFCFKRHNCSLLNYVVRLVIVIFVFKNWQLKLPNEPKFIIKDFDEYIRQGEPDKKEKDYYSC